LLRGLRVRLATLVTVVVTSRKIHQLPRIDRILYLGPFATCVEVHGRD